VLLAVLRGRLGGVEGLQTARTLARVLVASACMGAVVFAVLTWGNQRQLPPLVLVLAAGGTGAIIYLLLSRLLGVREIDRFARALARKS